MKKLLILFFAVSASMFSGLKSMEISGEYGSETLTITIPNISEQKSQILYSQVKQVLELVNKSERKSGKLGLFKRALQKLTKVVAIIVIPVSIYLLAAYMFAVGTGDKVFQDFILKIMIGFFGGLVGLTVYAAAGIVSAVIACLTICPFGAAYCALILSTLMYGYKAVADAGANARSWLRINLFSQKIYYV